MAATVLKWHKHKFFRCKIPECKGCAFCTDGVIRCSVCFGTAGSTLPTDCPGQPIEEWDQALIQGGMLDYTRNLGWQCVGE